MKMDVLLLRISSFFVLVTSFSIPWLTGPARHDRSCRPVSPLHAVSRRHAWHRLVVPLTMATLLPLPTVAANNLNDNNEPASTAVVDRIVSEFLRDVPTFTIVDTDGIPYMVVGEDAKVTAYLFLSYSEAERILRLAKQSTEKDLQQQRRDAKSEDQGIPSNPWTSARISTVPLETAVALAVKSAQTKGNYFRLAASATEIDNALTSTGQVDLAEGKVPLFYYADFTNDQGKTPLYFAKKQLETAYRRAHPRVALPPVQVTELVAILSAMAQLDATSNDLTSSDLTSLVLVAPVESAAQAAQCQKRGGTAPPLVLGQRNLIL